MSNGANPVRDRAAEVVIAVAIATGAWWMVGLPAHERHADAARRLAAAEMELEQVSDSETPDPDRVRSTFERLDAWAAAIHDPLSAGARLQHAADEIGVRIERLAPSDGAESMPRGPLVTHVRRFEMVVAGSGEGIGRLLDRLSAEPMVTVRAFELAPGEAEGDVIGVVSIETTRITVAEATTPEVIP